jgi:hypothetical protein
MDLSSLRDIALIILAFEGFVIGLLLLALTFGAVWAMRKFRQWLGENISRGMDLLQNLRAEVEKVSMSIAEPFIKIDSSIAATRETVRHIRNKLSWR